MYEKEKIARLWMEWDTLGCAVCAPYCRCRSMNEKSRVADPSPVICEKRSWLSLKLQSIGTHGNLPLLKEHRLLNIDWDG